VDGSRLGEGNEDALRQQLPPQTLERQREKAGKVEGLEEGCELKQGESTTLLKEERKALLAE
jgi:hypothetical protein